MFDKLQWTQLLALWKAISFASINPYRQEINKDSEDVHDNLTEKLKCNTNKGTWTAERKTSCFLHSRSHISAFYGIQNSMAGSIYIKTMKLFPECHLDNHKDSYSSRYDNLMQKLNPAVSMSELLTIYLYMRLADLRNGREISLSLCRCT